MGQPPRRNEHRRRRSLSNLRYQLGFATLLLLAQVVGAAAFQCLFQWRVAQVIPRRSPDEYNMLLGSVLDESLGCMSVVAGSMGVLLFFLGIWYSNRMVGPLPRIRRALRAINGGRYGTKLILRRGDVLKGLVEDLNAMSETLQRRHYADSLAAGDEDSDEAAARQPEVIHL